MAQLDSVTFSIAYMNHGALTWGPGAISEEYANILQHFAKVFEQTYTRFLDLKQAEAQIEAALEKIRSRSLAMHRWVIKPDYLWQDSYLICCPLNGEAINF